MVNSSQTEDEWSTKLSSEKVTSDTTDKECNDTL